MTNPEQDAQIFINELLHEFKGQLAEALRQYRFNLAQSTGVLPGQQLPTGGPTGTGYPPAPTDHATITDWQEAVEDVIGAAIVAGANIAVSYDDATGKTTVAATATGDLTYRHVQSSPASTWTVIHNLGKYVAVSTVDSAGDEVFGDVHYNSNDQVTITFSAAFGGEAYVN